MFDLVNVGSGFFQIRARHSGKCLTLETGRDRVGNGTRIVQFPCRGGGYQSEQWSFKPMNGCADNGLCIDAGWRLVKNRYTGRCLDTANPSGRKPRQQAVLQLWTCISSTRAWNADNQIWKVVDASTKKPVRELR